MKLAPAQAPWMHTPSVSKLMQALSADGGAARFVGGAVRNTLLGLEIGDIDLATPLVPDEVVNRLKTAGIAFAPTGIEHGTITAIVDRQPFEVTSLRRDVTTDGRRAVVSFTTAWQEDSNRRDFTINALYASPDGEIFDYHNGLADLSERRVRFIGDARTRIREDYLRILRLFRFHTWYGKGEIDAQALAAATAEKAGLAQLSGERVQAELLRLLEASDPAPDFRVMTRAGILDPIWPGMPDIARLEKLCAIDAANFFSPDAVLRLAALALDENAEPIADRLKLSNNDRARLVDLAGAQESIVSYLSIRETRKWLYRLGRQRFRDRVLLRWAEDPKTSNATGWRALLAVADAWQRPAFPITGKDVMKAGIPEGPLVGKILGEVETWWIDSDFPDDAFALAERLKAVVQASAY